MQRILIDADFGSGAQKPGEQPRDPENPVSPARGWRPVDQRRRVRELGIELPVDLADPMVEGLEARGLSASDDGDQEQ